jgi:pimeloyl-ACP methyl ester carboxylesterase
MPKDEAPQRPGSDLPADEFAMLGALARDLGLTRPGLVVRREFVRVPSGATLSALVWGSAPPGIVLLHGRAQNAHTWDAVALALDQPVIALDLPGHGHSDWRAEHDYFPAAMSTDVAYAIDQLAPKPEALVGMSLGGLTAICVADDRPELGRRLALIDITPGIDQRNAGEILAFVTGERYFDNFEDLVLHSSKLNHLGTAPVRREGVRHNARQLKDGRWTWRYDPDRPPLASTPHQRVRPYEGLWDALGRVGGQVALLRGAQSSIVTDEDIAELQRRQPGARVVTVPGAGHTIQRDQPVRLAAELRALTALSTS